MDLTSALLAERQPGAGMAGSGASIAGNLFADHSGAFQKAALGEATLQDKLIGARKKRDEEVARHGAEAKLVDAGVPPAQAALVSNLMMSGNSYIQAMSGEADRQKMVFRGQAHDAAVGRYGADNPNAHLFPLANAPQAMGQAVGSGGYVADRFAGDAPVQMTELGQAMIGAQSASANQRNAAANLSNVRASTGGYAPRASGGAGGAEKQTPFKVPSHTELNAALFTTVGDGFNKQTVPDVERQAEFRKWQIDQAEHDPQYRDGNYALSQFLAGRPAMSQPYDFGAGPTRLKAGYDPSIVGMLKSEILARRAAGEPDLSKAELNEMARQFRETGTATAPAAPGGVDAAARSAGVPPAQTAASAARSGAVTQSAPARRLKYNPATGKIE